MMVREVDVCLRIETVSATVAELTSRIGVEGAEGSHDKGTTNFVKSRPAWSSTIYQVCSTLPHTASVEEHLEALLATLAPARVGPGTLPLDARKYISIGVFSDDQIPVLMLTERTMAIAALYGASIELRWHFIFDDKLPRKGKTASSQ